MPIIWYVVFLCFSVFLIGALPFSLMVARCFGVKSLRQGGSGNPGATNVARLAGKKAGAIALMLDVMKGFLPAWFLSSLVDANTVSASSAYIVPAFFAMLATLGHIFSPFLLFRGGKGVATFLGGLAATDILVSSLFCGLWICFYSMKRVSAHGAIAALSGSAAVAFLLWPWPAASCCAFAAIVSIFRHRSNLKRMLKGEEFSFKNKGG